MTGRCCAPATDASSCLLRWPTPSATRWAKSTWEGSRRRPWLRPCWPAFRSRILPIRFRWAWIRSSARSYGRYTNLGSAVSVDEYQQRTPISDRFNVSFQRQLPGKFIADVTYFINFVSRDQYSLNLNMMDPRLSYKYGSALTQTVNNPFFNYGTPETFPGASLRNARTVSVGSLLVPYPQYGTITQTGTDLRSARYQSLQLRGQRAFDHGFSLLATYAYVTTRSQWFYDPQDEYDSKLTTYNFT